MIFAGDRILSTPTELAAAERGLLDQTGGHSVVWCGRAAGALYWAYKIAAQSAHFPEPEIIVPATSCASPALCVTQAGSWVRFADVDRDSGMPTLETIQARWTAATCAVVFIHLYGQTADLSKIAAWCSSHKALLIEDCAQAQGARLPNGDFAGTAGDLAVVSFNRTKILECGGGALVARTPHIAALLKEVLRESQPSRIEGELYRELALSQRNLYHALVTLRRNEAASDVATAFRSLEDGYASLYVRPLDDAASLAQAWPGIPAIVAERYRKAEIYSAKLRGGPWALFDGWRASGVCWRYSLAVEHSRAAMRLTACLRHDGFYVSNLYWPLNDLLRPEDSCPNADWLGRRVLNLWVDQTVDRNRVEKCAESLWRHGEKLAGHPGIMESWVPPTP